MRRRPRPTRGLSRQERNKKIWLTLFEHSTVWFILRVFSLHRFMFETYMHHSLLRSKIKPWTLKEGIIDDCCSVHGSVERHFRHLFHSTLNIVSLGDFDRASSLICGNKMPTRCNKGFYCRSYCLLNMFQAPLCLSSTPDQQLENYSTK